MLEGIASSIEVRMKWHTDDTDQTDFTRIEGVWLKKICVNLQNLRAIFLRRFCRFTQIK